MLFVDRLFIAMHSPEALIAVVASGTLSWAFTCCWWTMSSMSEVFVAQYNGSGQIHKLARPVWQMLWISLFSFLFFIPLGIWGSPLIYAEADNAGLHISYFRWTVFFSPLFTIIGALSAFYVGQGTTKVLTYVSILGNLVNILLDPVLIFGWGNIPSLGVQGAALATGAGLVVQTAVLALCFFKKSNREEKGTGDYSLDWDLMKKCVKVAMPPALFVLVEIGGWALFLPHDVSN